MFGACEFKPNSLQDKDAEELQNKRSEIIRLAVMATVIIVVGWLHLLKPIWLGNIIIIVAVAAGGYPIFKESFFALKKGRVNMELSMVIAIVASLVLFQFLPAIVITFFALLSEFVEGFIVQKGRKNIQLLYDLAPKKAIIKRYSNSQKEDNISLATTTTIEIPVDNVRVGDSVVVREGDTIPVDGHVIKGESTINQASITGESSPVEKCVGDTVLAGTMNLTQPMEIQCDKPSTDTTFARIIHLVEEAEASKAPIQKLSDKLATRLIQFAIGLSALTFIVTHNIVSTLSVIVVAGACGLAVGTPIALLASNGRLSRRGLVVKGGLQIENLSDTGTIVFDKTGTLTTGKPVVSEVVSFDTRIHPIKILEYAAIAERNINHPIAKAIVTKAHETRTEIKMENNNNYSTILDKSDTDYGNKKELEIKVGKGVAISHKGRRIAVGNMKFMEDETQPLSSNIGNDTSRQGFSLLLNMTQYQYLTKTNLNGEAFQKFNPNEVMFSSSTTVFVSLDRQIIGAVLLEDKLRPETRDVIAKIKAMNIHVIMLTGDNERIANKVAKESGIEEYHANMLPEDKVSIIEEIVKGQKKGEKNRKQGGGAVVMVGDGINDAPALAKADVGIAMGRTGTDVAIETADVVLMTEDLAKIPYLLKTSRQSLFVIKQNFFGTIFVDGLGFILAFVGIINPLLAAIIHVSSELIFMTNSARLIVNRNGAIKGR
jgi:heavy metal translocating P-type ATPase